MLVCRYIAYGRIRMDTFQYIKLNIVKPKFRTDVSKELQYFYGMTVCTKPYHQNKTRIRGYHSNRGVLIISYRILLSADSIFF